jgi:hypothetical protein
LNRLRDRLIGLVIAIRSTSTAASTTTATSATVAASAATTTVAATAAATTVAAATATAAVSTTAATAARTIVLRSGFVAGNSAACNFLLVQTFDRRRSFIWTRHFDESKPARTAGFPVGNNANLCNLTKTAESLTYLFFRRSEREIPYIDIRH